MSATKTVGQTWAVQSSDVELVSARSLLRLSQRNYVTVAGEPVTGYEVGTVMPIDKNTFYVRVIVRAGGGAVSGFISERSFDNGGLKPQQD